MEEKDRLQGTPGRHVAHEEGPEAVLVQKVAQSTGSKVMAAGLPALGALLAFLNGLPPYPRAAVIVAATAAGAWLWDRSKTRQMQTQLALVEKAASPEKNTVVIAPPSAKAG